MAMKITAAEVRAAAGNRYAHRLATLQAEREEIVARERRADDVVAAMPVEFRGVFRAAVEEKRAAFDVRVARWQAAVDLDPTFWGQPMPLKVLAD